MKTVLYRLYHTAFIAGFFFVETSNNGFVDLLIHHHFMVTIESVRQMALSFPETDEHSHFERKAFRVKKKIFATLSEKDHTVNLKLSLVDQSVFCAYDPEVIHPVPGGWGSKGATTVHLKKIRKGMFKDILTTAYCTVAPKNLSAKYLPR